MSFGYSTLTTAAVNRPQSSAFSTFAILFFICFNRVAKIYTDVVCQKSRKEYKKYKDLTRVRTVLYRVELKQLVIMIGVIFQLQNSVGSTFNTDFEEIHLLVSS